MNYGQNSNYHIRNNYNTIELEIISVNGTPIDTVVVFKKNNNYGKQNKFRNK